MSYESLARSLNLVETNTPNEWCGTCPYPECRKSGHFYFNVKSGLGICFRCNRRVNASVLKRLSKTNSILRAVNSVFGHGKPFKAARDLKSIFTEVSMPVDRLTGDDLDAWLQATEIGELANGYLCKLIDELWETHHVDFDKYSGVRVSTVGKYRDSLLIPIYMTGPYDVPNNFVVRALWGGSRYLGPSNDSALKKSACLFSGTMATDPPTAFNLSPKRSMVVLVEGVLDAMAMGDNVFALMGKTISDDQVRALSTINPATVVVLLDSDVPMKEIMAVGKKCAETLNSFVMIGKLESGDPADDPAYAWGCVANAEPFDGLADLLGA